MKCKDLEPIIGCLSKDDGTFEPVIIHYTYGVNAQGVEIIESVRYSLADGTIRELEGVESVKPGPCCCPTIKEHYLCIDNVKTAVWVSIQPDTFGIIQVVNSLDLSTVDASLYSDGFLTPCGTCEDCNPFSTATGTTPCNSIRIDATPGGLSDGTLQMFTGCLLDGPKGSDITCGSAGDFPKLDFSTALATPVVPGVGGSTVAAFADLINSTWGAYGFSAAYCNGEKIAITGPMGAGNWSIYIAAPGNGDGYELIWDDVNSEFSEIEYANGTEITPQVGDTVMANGFHPANGCGNCDTP